MLIAVFSILPVRKVVVLIYDNSCLCTLVLLSDFKQLSWSWFNLIDLKLADPYQWLENPYSKETKQFVDVQSQSSQSCLKKCDVWEKNSQEIDRNIQL